MKFKWLILIVLLSFNNNLYAFEKRLGLFASIAFYYIIGDDFAHALYSYYVIFDKKLVSLDDYDDYLFFDFFLLPFSYYCLRKFDSKMKYLSMLVKLLSRIPYIIKAVTSTK